MPSSKALPLREEEERERGEDQRERGMFHH